jgi:membrane-associated phospholipid phosphatase
MDSVSADFFQYQPGLWSQDMVTLPLEASLVYLATEYLPTTKPPLWPFADEKNTAVRHETRHPGTFVVQVGALMAVPAATFAVLKKTSSFALSHVRGYAHTALLTELGTLAAKRFVGRHRPNYDTTLAASGRVPEDDSYSFWSGHSAHSFAFSTYLSRFTFELASKPVAWGSAAVYYGVASWIATGRVLDNAHHVSDVVVGAAVGSALSWWVFDKVNALPGVSGGPSEASSRLLLPKTSGWSFSPSINDGGLGVGFSAIF